MTERHYPRFRRRNFFIKKRFQFNFIIYFIIALFSVSLIYGFALYVVLDKKFDKALYTPHLRLESTGEILLPPLIYLNIITIIGMFFISVVIIALILRKIQDPLRRLRIAAQRVEMGNLVLEESPRTGHLAVEVGEEFIKAIRYNRKRVVRLKDSANRLRIMAEKFKILAELKEIPREKAKEIVRDLESEKNEFNKILSEFKTE